MSSMRRFEIPEFSDKQLDRLSEFFSNFSLLIMATLVLPNIFGVDKPNMIDLTLGLIVAVGLLLLSMILVKKD